MGKTKRDAQGPPLISLNFVWFDAVTQNGEREIRERGRGEQPAPAAKRSRRLCRGTRANACGSCWFLGWRGGGLVGTAEAGVLNSLGVLGSGI